MLTYKPNSSFLIVFCSLLILASLSSCEPSRGVDVTVSPFASFRDIPGITAEEISAIETLRGQYDRFIYGVDYSTEAFPVYSQDNQSGEYVVGGYSALFCEWLTHLFGIPFTPKLYEDDWDNFLADMENGKVHFTGDLMATEERRRTYFMTSAIAERTLKAFQIDGSLSIATISESRPPRLAFPAFPRNSAPYNYVVKTAEYTFETVFADNLAHAYSLLSSGEADAFVTMNSSEPVFEHYGNVVCETFYPLVFAPVSLSTRIADLQPVISVMQKALDNGGRHYLTGLYTQGRIDYVKNEMFRRLTGEERDYIRNNPIVRIAAEDDNYPLSFYNDKDREYQGIAFDVLNETKQMTGLSFKVVNAMDAGFQELTDMVENHEASLIAYLRRSK
jgi:ABC-type amino acid transport substrate-binding protein